MVEYQIIRFNEAQNAIIDFVIKHRVTNSEDLILWRYEKLSDFEHINAVAMRGNTIVGLKTYFIKNLLINGKKYPFGDSGHIQVEKEFGGMGIFSNLLSEASRSAEQEGVKFFYGIPTLRIMRIFLKQGWQYIGDILSFSRRVSIYKNLFHILKNETLCKFLDTIYFFFTSSLSRYPLVSTKGYSFHETTEFNDQYEELCRKINRDIPIMRLRDKWFLKWRYIDKPFKKKQYKFF